ncbi:hypothetical protein BBAD15_g12551 [Beauveria bassiana D1-5]|uniref:Uncharacterized protein n=1 Tax=Beauveria bassiana D1-5 TaxID=1245745 RepID=A0A0A2VN33_BEABA|nr:hypothetical protein BBAD15_g12551 [Beauveria bassiana D1-5]
MKRAHTARGTHRLIAELIAHGRPRSVRGERNRRQRAPDLQREGTANLVRGRGAISDRHGVLGQGRCNRGRPRDEAVCRIHCQGGAVDEGAHGRPDLQVERGRGRSRRRGAVGHCHGIGGQRRLGAGATRQGAGVHREIQPRGQGRGDGIAQLADPTAATHGNHSDTDRFVDQPGPGGEVGASRQGPHDSHLIAAGARLERGQVGRLRGGDGGGAHGHRGDRAVGGDTRDGVIAGTVGDGPLAGRLVAARGIGGRFAERQGERRLREAQPRGGGGLLDDDIDHAQPGLRERRAGP